MTEELIYLYEAKFLEFLNGIDSSIVQITYAKDVHTVSAMASTQKFPVAIYSREEINWDITKIIQARFENRLVRFQPFEQTYSATIFVENQEQALSLASNIRFYWNKNPYLVVNWPFRPDELRIGLRLLSIKVGEERLIEDLKGAVRTVEIKWKSNLFLSEGGDGKIKTTLTDKIKIYLGVNGESIILKDENLIKEIK